MKPEIEKIRDQLAASFAEDRFSDEMSSDEADRIVARMSCKVGFDAGYKLAEDRAKVLVEALWSIAADNSDDVIQAVAKKALREYLK